MAPRTVKRSIPGRFFQISRKEEKKPSLGVSEVDSSLSLCVTLVMQLYEDDG